MSRFVPPGSSSHFDESLNGLSNSSPRRPVPGSTSNQSPAGVSRQRSTRVGRFVQGSSSASHPPATTHADRTPMLDSGLGVQGRSLVGGQGPVASHSEPQREQASSIPATIPPSQPSFSHPEALRPRISLAVRRMATQRSSGGPNAGHALGSNANPSSAVSHAQQPNLRVGGISISSRPPAGVQDPRQLQPIVSSVKSAIPAASGVASGVSALPSQETQHRVPQETQPVTTTTSGPRGVPSSSSSGLRRWPSSRAHRHTNPDIDQALAEVEARRKRNEERLAILARLTGMNQPNREASFGTPEMGDHIHTAQESARSHLSRILNEEDVFDPALDSRFESQDAVSGYDDEVAPEDHTDSHSAEETYSAEYDEGEDFEVRLEDIEQQVEDHQNQCQYQDDDQGVVAATYHSDGYEDEGFEVHCERSPEIDNAELTTPVIAPTVPSKTIEPTAPPLETSTGVLAPEPSVSADISTASHSASQPIEEVQDEDLGALADLVNVSEANVSPKHTQSTPAVSTSSTSFAADYLTTPRVRFVTPSRVPPALVSALPVLAAPEQSYTLSSLPSASPTSSPRPPMPAKPKCSEIPEPSEKELQLARKHYKLVACSKIFRKWRTITRASLSAKVEAQQELLRQERQKRAQSLLRAIAEGKLAPPQPVPTPQTTTPMKKKPLESVARVHSSASSSPRTTGSKTVSESPPQTKQTISTSSAPVSTTLPARSHFSEHPSAVHHTSSHHAAPRLDRMAPANPRADGASSSNTTHPISDQVANKTDKEPAVMSEAEAELRAAQNELAILHRARSLVYYHGFLPWRRAFEHVNWMNRQAQKFADDNLLRAALTTWIGEFRSAQRKAAEEAAILSAKADEFRVRQLRKRGIQGLVRQVQWVRGRSDQAFSYYCRNLRLAAIRNWIGAMRLAEAAREQRLQALEPQVQKMARMSLMKFVWRALKRNVQDSQAEKAEQERIRATRERINEWLKDINQARSRGKAITAEALGLDDFGIQAEIERERANQASDSTAPSTDEPRWVQERRMRVMGLSAAKAAVAEHGSTPPIQTSKSASSSVANGTIASRTSLPILRSPDRLLDRTDFEELLDFGDLGSGGLLDESQSSQTSLSEKDLLTSYGVRPLSELLQMANRALDGSFLGPSEGASSAGIDHASSSANVASSLTGSTGGILSAMAQDTRVVRASSPTLASLSTGSPADPIAPSAYAAKPQLPGARSTSSGQSKPLYRS